MPIRGIPINLMIVWVCVFIPSAMICLMPLHFCVTIVTDLGFVYFAIWHDCCFYLTWISKIPLILRLIRIGSPFSTICAAHTLA